MKEKIKAHLWTLPRWFALPCAVCSVLLGISLGGHWSWLSLMVVLGALFEMAGAHSWNSFLDKEWTHFDEGGIDERSKEKVYTGGQSIIEAGVVRSREVLANALGWYAISAIFIGVAAVHIGPIIWLFWLLGALVTGWYSQAKKYWHPELALGVGFAFIPAMMGMATQPNPDYLLAGLASIPFFIMFSVVCEGLDQWVDASANWTRGGRSLGMLVWKMGGSIVTYAAWWIAIGYIAQLFLVQADILKPLTALSLVATVPLAFAIATIAKEPDTAIVTGLGGVFVFHILLVVGQVLG
ncbi:hypothetical protein ES707_15868 [subsurface metagenome]